MSSRFKRWLCILIAVACAFSALYFGFMFWQIKKEYHRGEADLKLIEEIRGDTSERLTDTQKAQMDEASRRAEEEKERQEKLEGYERLKTQNKDLIGWITIDGTAIDYPVMQTPEEPDYYLRRGFDKRYSVYGMIYMDASCLLEGNCSNYILYGHHMKNGTMFASIEEYKSEAFWKEHKKLIFDTLNEEGKYEILAAFRLPAAQMNVDFAYKLAANTEEDYNNFLDYINEHRLYDTGVTANWPDQLVTLTTCEYTQKDGRFFVVARKSDSHALE